MIKQKASGIEIIKSKIVPVKDTHPVLRLLLVRHGESEANADNNKNKEQGDNAHKLTMLGHEQARRAGRFINAFFQQPEILAEQQALAEKREQLIYNKVQYNKRKPFFVAANPDRAQPPKPMRYKPYVRLWNSPFVRTQETSAEIETHAKSVITDTHENSFIYEMQFGLYDGLSPQEKAEKYPDAVEHAEKYRSSDGLHWAITPLGENRAYVGHRVRELMGSINRDLRQEDINNHIVVAHGLTNRLIFKEWMHQKLNVPYKNMKPFIEEKNPGNCHIRMIEGHYNPAKRKYDYIDRGYIYTGKMEEIEAMEKKAGIAR